MSSKRAALVSYDKATDEISDDLPALVTELNTVDRLTAGLPRVPSGLSANDRVAITLCDLQGICQAGFVPRI